MTLNNAIYLVLGTLGLAVFIIVADGVIIHFKLPTVGPGHRMGKSQWDFSKSWASTITVIGALLGSILSTKGIGTPVSLYAALSIFFGILVVIAPLLYSTTGVEQIIDTSTAQQSMQYQGRVWAFLFTCGLTLWAVFGELCTTVPLLNSLVTAPTQGQQVQPFFGSSLILMLQVCVIVAIVLVAFYGLNSIRWTVEEQASDDATKKRQQALHVAKGKYLQELDATGLLQELDATGNEKFSVINNKAQNQLEPELPTWSLL